MGRRGDSFRFISSRDPTYVDNMFNLFLRKRPVRVVELIYRSVSIPRLFVEKGVRLHLTPDLSTIGSEGPTRGNTSCV